MHLNGVALKAILSVGLGHISYLWEVFGKSPANLVQYFTLFSRHFLSIVNKPINSSAAGSGNGN